MRSRVVGGGWAVIALVLAAAPAAAQQPPGLGLGLFQFFAFYAAGDLEITPGPAFAVHGRVHTQGDLYLDGSTSLTIGDEPAAGVFVVQATAGGHVYRGRKDTNQCSGTVRIDTFSDVLPPLGDLDDRSLPCLSGGTRLVPASEIASWGSVMAEQSPYASVPGPDIIHRDGPYWQLANLRIALRVNPTPPHSIEVLNADGTVAAVQTAALQSFMFDEGWNRGTTPGQGPSTLPGTAPVFYTDVPLGTAGCDCGPGTPTCGSQNRSCYAPAFGFPLAPIPPYPADPNRVYGRNMFDHDPRRGGFYNYRERKWMLLLNVNVADLIRWNDQHGSPFFLSNSTFGGGLVLYFTVIGPDSDGVNAYGARVFGSANLPLPGGIGTGQDPTGLTIVSDQALYVLGDFNRGVAQPGDLPRQPAALVGDTINMLSSRYWDPACSSTACRDGQSPLPLNATPRAASATIVNAALLGGVDTTLPGSSNGGLQNFPRLHESWVAVVQHYRGSFVSLGPPEHAAGPWCGTGSACNIYNPPTRDWDFESAFVFQANLPPLTLQLQCGNGTVEEGEACDAGAAFPGGGCCAPTCNRLPSGAACFDDAKPCTVDACDGGDTCVHAPGNAGTVCRVAAGECDVAESCDGIGASCPANAFVAPGTPCTDDGAPCTDDACDGAGTCAHPPGHAGTECRPSAGDCDVHEVCDGTSTTCPADAVADATVTCRPAADLCDAPEQCDGVGRDCPPDAVRDAGSVCRPAAGECDLAESCDGIAPSCPADAKRTDVCRGSTGGCDAAEYCDGVGNDCTPDR